MQSQQNKNNSPHTIQFKKQSPLQKKGHSSNPFFTALAQPQLNHNPFHTALQPSTPSHNPFQTALNSSLQTKLSIGQPNDPYEQEADRIADQVVSMPGTQSVQKKCATCETEEGIQTKSLASQITPINSGFAQKKCAACGAEEQLQGKFIQKQGEASSQLESQINSSKGGGSSMDTSTQSLMSNSFGADLSGVRIHTGSPSVQMNQELGARAFTVGNDIHFNQGEYNPGSQDGKKLLAHELVHTIQQSSASDQVQRSIGDGHDLTSPRFAGESTLEDIYDGSGSLAHGASGSTVEKIQHALQDAGFLLRRYGVDGEYGDETQNAVSRFQSRHRVTGDTRGEVGQATLTALDRLFPRVALPSNASDPFDFACMLEILCAWNAPLINDLRNLQVILVEDLQWSDERYDGSSWVPHPMDGAGETSGRRMYIATDDTCENVAKTLYHEYQHARSPLRLASASWGEEEQNAYTLETSWAIARGVTPDPSLVTTDPTTGETTVDSSGVDSHVESYPGLDTANPGEVIEKVGTNRVRVRMPNGSVTVRNAMAGDTVPGARQINGAQRRVRDAEWTCP